MDISVLDLRIKKLPLYLGALLSVWVLTVWKEIFLEWSVFSEGENRLEGEDMKWLEFKKNKVILVS